MHLDILSRADLSHKAQNTALGHDLTFGVLFWRIVQCHKCMQYFTDTELWPEDVTGTSA